MRILNCFFGKGPGLVSVGAVLVALVVWLPAAMELQAAPPPATKIIIEFNATDEDAGIQMFFDADGWIRLEVFDPDGFKAVDVTASGGVQMQGMTEFFFESEEPTLDEFSFEDLFARFPAGQYTFQAVTKDGEILTGKATLTHRIPDGPEVVSPEEDEVVSTDDAVIEWLPVANPSGGKIVGYQVIVVQEKPTLRVFSADVPATTTSMTIPEEFLQPNTKYKVEVLAVESSGNQTITEVLFRTN